MAATKSRGERWAEYRPSKAAWLWSCIGAAVLTGVVGFTWGGWVTGGTAREMAEQARYELATAVCVDRFMKQADAGIQLTALKKENSWNRNEFVVDGGWSRMPDVETAPRPVSNECAERLASMEAPAEAAAAAGTTVQ